MSQRASLAICNVWLPHFSSPFKLRSGDCGWKSVTVDTLQSSFWSSRSSCKEMWLGDLFSCCRSLSKKRAPTEGFSMLSTECTWVKLMQWRQNRPTNMFPCRFDLHLQILSFVIYELGQQWQKRKGGCKCTGVNWRNKRKIRSQPNKDAERKSGLGKYSNLQAVSLMDAEGSLQGLDRNTLASFALTSRLSDGNRNTIFGSFIPLSDGCIMIVVITCWKIQIKTKQVLQLQSVVGKSAPVQS